MSIMQVNRSWNEIITILLYYSPALTRRQVKSAKHKRNFTLNPANGGAVKVLSVSSEGQLLVGQLRDS